LRWHRIKTPRARWWGKGKKTPAEKEGDKNLSEPDQDTLTKGLEQLVIVQMILETAVPQWRGSRKKR